MRWWAGAFLGISLAGAIAVAIIMRLVPDDPADWHIDPATAERADAPNDYLVAPEGATAARPDRTAEVHALPPGELLRRFDAVATGAPRTERIAGTPDEGWITYVQRSRVFGFPDYVSVRALDVPGGSALVVWSRSRFGYGDFGVNKDRVEGWLAALDG
jgi:uncharacterized protein (DUF1499 family)